MRRRPLSLFCERHKGVQKLIRVSADRQAALYYCPKCEEEAAAHKKQQAEALGRAIRRR
jgi:hypothetical protein